MKQKILIVDDHYLVLEGFKTLLQNEAFEIFTCSNGKETYDFLKKEAVDIAFLDINLPDTTGIELCAFIKQNYSKTKCLALSNFNERAYVDKMKMQGADGYLLKNASKDDIKEAIQTVNQGNKYFFLDDDKPKKAIFEKPTITRREKEVLKEIAEGLTNQQIAEKLFISITTVNTHRQHLLIKLEANNTATLLKNALKYELI